MKSRHQLVCENYYNRLQADPSDDELFVLLEELLGFGLSSPYHAVEHVLSKFDGNVATLQINNSRNLISYRASLHFKDLDAKPKHGHLYPSVTVVKTSSRMIHAVILAYIEICKNIGRFV
jgi:hypothetical protein